MIKGVGTLADSSTVIISNSRGLETDRIKSKHIIIATGGRARAFPGVKIDGKLVITSKEALLMNHPPKSMIIVGAGSIGIEFGYLYHKFGTKIEIVEMMSNILPTVDREISDLLKRNFEKKGIRIHTKATVKSIKPYKNKVTAKIAHVDGIREISADCCLIAIVEFMET